MLQKIWRVVGFAVFTIFTAGGTVMASEQSDAAQMLERMKTLAGEWEGSYQWSGARTNGGDIGVRYSVASRGSTVIEELIEGGETSMFTVYHLDGEDLRMTHFCAAQNQPRLKADMIDADSGHVTFEFIDATNVGPDNPGYVEGFEMRIINDNTLNIKFRFKGGSPLAIEDINVRRVNS